MSQALFGKIFDLSYQNTDFLKYLTLIEWKDDSAECRLRLNRTSANMNTTPTFDKVGVLYSQKYFKEELQMSNSSTSPVQYPLPYKAVDGCLYMEKANKNGTATRKLCNFLPYLKCDINVDDGVEQTRTFRIAGIHESGRLLPEIEVTVKEFGKMDWVLERWGAECIIEPGNSNRENICCAILKTVENAEKKNVYRTTGWHLIDGKWEYLLPNDGKHDVRLFGKLRHYEMANHWSDSDLKTVWSMIKEKMIATKAIIWTLIAFVFLTPLNEFFRQVFYEPKFVLCLIGKTGLFYEPKFVLCLIGKTGSRKSTLAALFLSFFGRFSGTDLSLSFSDTFDESRTTKETD